MPSSGKRRCSRKRRTAPVTIVSTTSLSEPPSARRTAFSSSSGSTSQSKRRCGLTRSFSGVGELRWSAPPSISRTARAAHGQLAPCVLRLAHAACACRARPRRAGARGAPARRAAARRESAPAAARTAPARRSPRRASGLISTFIRSTPETPSIMQWWTFEISAKRSSSRPSTTHISQSGRERSRRCAMMRAASCAELRGVAGPGQARVAHVVVEVEALVVHPDRARLRRGSRRGAGGSAGCGAARPRCRAARGRCPRRPRGSGARPSRGSPPCRRAAGRAAARGTGTNGRAR